MTHPARWWRADPDGRLTCTLCPRLCRIPSGQHGFCYVRANEDGRMVTHGYGHLTELAIDPVEKKPLSHFLPGTPALSFGTAGCNLGCQFCPNGSITRAREAHAAGQTFDPEDLIGLAIAQNCPSLAFTHNDPTIYGEFVIDVARLARQMGIRTIMVSSGYITPEARDEIYPYIDAANIDLKAFSERFYRRVALGALEPVKDTLRWLKTETDVWLEITTLLIPGENDDPDELRAGCDWIVETLGTDVPLHFTAFHPDHRMTDRPKTPARTLGLARQIARDAGLKYVYARHVNDPDGEVTFCPHCEARLIERDWYDVRAYRLVADRCPACDTRIPGVFPVDPPTEFFGRQRVVFT